MQSPAVLLESDALPVQSSRQRAADSTCLVAVVAPESESVAKVSCVRVYMALLEPKRAKKEVGAICSRENSMAKNAVLSQ